MAQRDTQGRTGTILIGLLFCAVALAIVFVSRPLSTGAVVAALIIGALGLDALLAAWQGRRALLSRIGPLP